MPNETMAVFQPQGGLLVPERCIAAYARDWLCSRARRCRRVNKCWAGTRSLTGASKYGLIAPHTTPTNW